MTPFVPLIAHYNGQTGRREVSLRVVTIHDKTMLVLWENKLVPVHSSIPGLTLDRVEYVQDPTVEDRAGKVTESTGKREKKTKPVDEA
jgi:hypothetical protein